MILDEEPITPLFTPTQQKSSPAVQEPILDTTKHDHKSSKVNRSLDTKPKSQIRSSRGPSAKKSMGLISIGSSNDLNFAERSEHNDTLVHNKSNNVLPAANRSVMMSRFFSAMDSAIDL